MTKDEPSMVIDMRPGIQKKCANRSHFRGRGTTEDGWDDFFKPVRADIFVESAFTNGQSSVRSDIIGRSDG
jgi:hypothetical protein